MTESSPREEPQTDAYWWTPYAVLAAIVLAGLLGYLGKLGSDSPAPDAEPAAAPAASTG